MTKGLEVRQEGRCSVYYEKKMRFCRQHVSKKAPEELSSNPDFQPLYCGNHYHLYANHIDNAKQPESSKRLKVTHGRKGKRIPCPLDPSHTIYEFMLSSHLKKCNKTKNEEEARAQVFYEDGINKGGHGASRTIKSNDELNPKSMDTNQLARQILMAFQNTFMRDSKKPIETLTDEDIYHAIKLKDYHQAEVNLGLESVTTKHQVKIGGEKHMIQIGSILGHCRELGLLDANVVLEMGAGRATTGFVVSGVCAKTKKVKLIIVERGGSRSKADTALRRKTKEDNGNAHVSEPYLNVENVDLHRIKCDLAHVNVTTVLKVVESDDFQLCQEVNSDGKSQKNVLMIAKHLCGAGTDLALKSIYPIRNRINGCILATCCHGLCNWSDYVGRSFLQKALMCDELKSFGDAEFEVMRKWACGTVTGPGSAASSTSKGDDHNFIDNAHEEQRNDPSLSKILKTNNFRCSAKGMGRACQRLIDYGRCVYMKETIFQNEQVNVGISHYVQDSVSPQNAMLYASIKQRFDSIKL